MTAPDLPAIRALLAGATPGPWEHDSDGFMGCGQVYTANTDLYGGNIAAPSGDLYPRSGYSPKGDMEFIAAAPSIVAQLLGVVERVEKVLEDSDHSRECDLYYAWREDGCTCWQRDITAAITGEGQ